jgi:ribosomal protein S11
MVKEKIKKIKKIKNKFYFGLKSLKKGRLYLRKSFSNIFLTFTDLKNKVVICKTSGILVLLVQSVENEYLWH